MFTDAPPRNKSRYKLFLDSDRLEMPLPPDRKLTELGTKIEADAADGRIYIVRNVSTADNAASNSSRPQVC